MGYSIKKCAEVPWITLLAEVPILHPGRVELLSIPEVTETHKFVQLSSPTVPEVNGTHLFLESCQREEDEQPV